MFASRSSTAVFGPIAAALCLMLAACLNSPEFAPADGGSGGDAADGAVVPPDGAGDTIPVDTANDDTAPSKDSSTDTAPAETGIVDKDDDGVADTEDNCPAIGNPGQADRDDDGTGDGCDGELALEDSGVRLVGPSGANLLGYRVAGLGDVNGDGFADVAVSEKPLPDSAKGNKMYLLSGKRISNSDSAAVDVSEAMGVLSADTGYNLSWLSQPGVGDVNGDGIDDLVVTGYNDNVTPASEAYLLIGREEWNGETPISESDHVFEASAMQATPGWSVTGVPDRDGDGGREIVLSNPMPDTGQRGSAFIVHSSELSEKKVELSEAAIRLDPPPSEDKKGVFAIGFQVAGREVGTNNSNDLLVGSYYADPFPSASNALRLIVHRRSFSALSRGVQHLSYQEFAFWGPNRSGEEPMWGSLANLGDLTGDTRDEFVVSRPRETFLGVHQTKVVSYFVESSRTEQAPSQARPILEPNGMPATVKPAGDIDGDGLTDLVVAVPGAEVQGEQVGVVCVIYGASLLRGSGAIDLESSDVRIIGEKGKWAGVGLASAGDVNGDGRGDFVIGAPLKEATASMSGEAYVVFGF